MPWNHDCTAGMAALGIPDFPTIAAVGQRQQAFLQKLTSSSVDPDLYEGLENCSATKCGRSNCTDACRFGAYRRARTSIVDIHWLLSNHAGPLYEVLVVRMCWSEQFGELHPSIGKAKKLNQRALRDLCDPSLTAVGAFKVWVADGCYFCGIHQIVAGIEEAELKKAFVPSEKVETAGIFWTKKIENLGKVIADILDPRLRPWKTLGLASATNEASKADQAAGWSTVSPAEVNGAPADGSRGTKARAGEYYTWRLGLKRDACLIRYRCDRHFNAIHKEPRVRVKKVPKKHPFPRGLEYHMFGGGRWTHIDPQGMDYVPKRLRFQGGSSDDPKVDYFSLDDDE
jgi:hypothetical protein